MNRNKYRRTSIIRKHRFIIVCFLIAAMLITSSALISKAEPIQSSDGNTPPIEKEANVANTNIQTSLSTEQQFECDVIYSYIGKGNSSDVRLSEITLESPGGYPIKKIINQYPVSQYPSAVYFNFTHSSNSLTAPCDVKFEVYLIEIINDKGLAEKYVWFEGTNYNPAFSDFDKADIARAKHLCELVDIRTLSGYAGHFMINWTTGASVVGGCIGSFGRYHSEPSNLALWSDGNPNTISVNIRILGWITLNGDSISVTSNDQKDTNIMRIQSQKFNDGFIFNKIVPSDQLSNVNLFNPSVIATVR
jgi:hypothetical protein